MSLFGREPVAWVGVIVAVAIAIIQALLGQNVISDAAAGKAIDGVNALAQIASIVIPVVVGVIAARRAVTPVVAPAVPSGTTVTALTPGGAVSSRTVV